MPRDVHKPIGVICSQRASWLTWLGDLIALRDAGILQSSRCNSDSRQIFATGQTTNVQPEPREKEDFPTATYHTIRGEILARVPGINPADVPGLLQMLVYTVRGPERGDMAQIRHALAGLETLWVEEIADLQEAIAAQQHDGLARGNSGEV